MTGITMVHGKNVSMSLSAHDLRQTTVVTIKTIGRQMNSKCKMEVTYIQGPIPNAYGPSVAREHFQMALTRSIATSLVI